MSLPLATGHLDRAAHLRRDEAWLAGAMVDPRSRILLVDPPGVAVMGEPPVLALADLDPIEDPDELLFLGLDGDVAVFAVDRRDLSVVDLKAVGSVLPEGHGAVAAQAIGLVGWHRRHKFCGVCGGSTTVGEAGYLRTCTTCATQHFPRTDPAVIMLVTHGDRALLGRQAIWPPGMWSVLAGFVEPGESPEDAVAREVFEEAGVRVKNVRYVAGQPWPFPASLMLGFRADAEDETLTVDTTELEEARWVSRDDLTSGADHGEFWVPPPVSIARYLIDGWLAEA